MTASKALVETLAINGVDTVFGVLGSTLLPVYDDLFDHPQIKLIAPRGEDGALHMADAYGRVTGKVGVGMITVGAGAAYSVSAMGEAYAESMPLLNIVTQVPTQYLDQEKGVYHECRDQMGFFKPVTGWCHRITEAADVPAVINEAFTRMQSGRPRPVMLEIPSDILKLESDFTLPSPARPGKPKIDDAQVGRVADLIAAAKRPLLWAGGGAVRSGAGPELTELAELLQAPVLGTNGSRGLIPDDHPLTMGNMMTMVPMLEEEVLNTADFMLALGTRFSERATRSTNKKATLDVTGRSAKGWTIQMPKTMVHVDIDAAEFNHNYPTQLGVQGDAREFLQKLLAELRARKFSPAERRVEQIAMIKDRAHAALHERVPVEMKLLDDLRAVVPRNGILAAQSIAGHWARYAFDMYEPGKFLFANTFGSMGYAFHAAIGAKIGCPERPVVALCGDGGFMFGCGELATVAHYKLAIPIVIFNNGGYKILQNTQKKRFGRHIGTDLTNPDFMKLADAFGLHSARVDDLGQLAPTVAAALKKDRATIIEVPVEFKPYR
jgi:acetolactate synthase-1/2/3 large subunit